MGFMERVCSDVLLKYTQALFTLSLKHFSMMCSYEIAYTYNNIITIIDVPPSRENMDNVMLWLRHCYEYLAEGIG